MAPMTPHRTDVEQNWLILQLGFVERVSAPLMPLDWLVHSGTQVGGGGVGKGVQGLDGHELSVPRSNRKTLRTEWFEDID